MAVKSGKVILKINPRHTSQTCIACGHVDATSRDGEKFICKNCGHVDDAFFASSQEHQGKSS
ncbi:MAG: zinc ribbon domain-containing protein [Heteroscytonema crispum UTEX LB 1556]